MRTLALLVVTCLLAWGLWSFFGAGEEPSPDHLPADPKAERSQPKAPPGGGVLLTTGVLTVTVRTSHGTAPAEATAGYLRGEGERVRRIDENGQVRFSDAPLGWVIAVAHAPGYADGSERHYVSAGLATDVVIVLKSPQDEEKKGEEQK